MEILAQTYEQIKTVSSSLNLIWQTNSKTNNQSAFVRSKGGRLGDEKERLKREAEFIKVPTSNCKQISKQCKI